MTAPSPTWVPACAGMTRDEGCEVPASAGTTDGARHCTLPPTRHPPLPPLRVDRVRWSVTTWRLRSAFPGAGQGRRSGMAHNGALWRTRNDQIVEFTPAGGLHESGLDLTTRAACGPRDARRSRGMAFPRHALLPRVTCGHAGFPPARERRRRMRGSCLRRNDGKGRNDGLGLRVSRFRGNDGRAQERRAWRCGIAQRALESRHPHHREGGI